MDPSKQSATSQTAYKWAFASNRTKADNDALQVARTEVGAATYGVDNRPPPTTSGGGSVKRVQGPTLPPQADRILAREDAEEKAAVERGYQRKRDKAEARERIEDMAGPREVGRERMLEKKRERREGDRAFREKGDEGLDIDEGTLMGGGDSFKAQCVAPLHHRWPRTLTDTKRVQPFLFAGLPAEMLRVRGLSRSARTRHRRRVSGRLRYVKRTRRLWTCSCSWPSRSMDNWILIEARETIDVYSLFRGSTSDPYVSGRELTCAHISASEAPSG